MTIDRDVGDCGVLRRSVDQADAAPFRKRFGSDIVPGLASVARELDESIIGANPDLTFGDGRFGDGKDGVVVLGARVIDVDGSSGRLLLALVVAREVRTDGIPMHSAVRGFEETLATVIERVGIVRRNHDRSGPLEAMLEVGCATAIAEFGLLGDAFGLSGAL